jgi:hypothetical protein
VMSEVAGAVGWITATAEEGELHSASWRSGQISSWWSLLPSETAITLLQECQQPGLYRAAYARKDTRIRCRKLSRKERTVDLQDGSENRS